MIIRIQGTNKFNVIYVRRFYLKILNNTIDECNGLDEDVLVNHPTNNESFLLRGSLNESEMDRYSHMKDIRLSNYLINIPYYCDLNNGDEYEFISNINVIHNSLNFKYRINNDQSISFWINKDGPNTGLIVYILTFLDGENYEHEKKFYISMTNNANIEYKGIDVQTDIIDPFTNTPYTFIGFENSEIFRSRHLDGYNIYTDTIFQINVVNYYPISDIQFEHKNLDLAINYDTSNHFINIIPNPRNLVIEKDTIIIKFNVLLEDHQKYERKLFIDISDYDITEYNGILSNFTQTDSYTNKNITIKGTQRSEPSLLENLLTVELKSSKEFLIKTNNKDYSFKNIKIRDNNTTISTSEISTKNNTIRELILKSDCKISSGIIALNTFYDKTDITFLRRFVLRIQNNQIVDFKGVQSLIHNPVIDPITNKLISIGPIPRRNNFNFDELNESEYDRENRLDSIELNNNVLTIILYDNLEIKGVAVQQSNETYITNKSNIPDTRPDKNGCEKRVLTFTANSPIVNDEIIFMYQMQC